MTQKSIFSQLCWFMGVYFVLWVGYAALRIGVPMDSAEAFVWGSEWTFGTNKHPFLSGWLAQIVLMLVPNPSVATGVLSAGCVCCALFFTYKLATCFLKEQSALLASLFLLGTIYYTTSAPEYNVNVLGIALLPAFFYVFYLATEHEKLSYWLGVGCLAGLLMITKYTNLLFLGAAGLYILCTGKKRRLLLTKGPYVAGCCFCAVMAPHLWYLPEVYDTVTAYYDSRSVPAKGGSLVVSLVRFLGAQVLAALGTLILLAILAVKQKRLPQFKKCPRYLVFIGVLPLCLFMLLGICKGAQLKSMWGYGTLGILPLIGLTMMQPLTQKVFKQMRTVCAVLLIALPFGMVIADSVHVSSRLHFDGQKFARELDALWQRNVATPLLFVGGDVFLSSQMYLYAPDHPHVVFYMDLEKNPWIDQDAFIQKGALVVTDNVQDYEHYQILYPKLMPPDEKQIILKNRLGKTKQKTVYVGILFPNDGDDHDI